MKKEAGRPKKYNNAYEDLLIDHLKEGNPFSTFLKKIFEYNDERKELCPCKRTLENWVNTIEPFRVARDIGLAYGESFWLEKAEGAERDPKFNSYYWFGRMRNQYGYRLTDKADSTSANPIEAPKGGLIKLYEGIQPTEGAE
jgi:hypothetical protein